MTSKARITGFTIITSALLIWVTLSAASVSGQTPPPEPAGEAGAPVNELCPVTTDEAIDPRFTAVYEGATIGLCCKKCLRKFEEDPEEYVANLPQFQTVALTQPDEDAAPEHDDHGEHAHDDDNHADAESAEAQRDEGSHERPAQGAVIEAAEHDHATGHDEKSRARIFTWLGKFHPPATDLPIAMLIGAALAEGLFIVSRREMFRHATVFCVLLAAAGAVPAVMLGWSNAGVAIIDDDWVQTTHRWLGTSTALMSLITLGLLLKCSKSKAPSALLRFRLALFASAGLVGATGFFGGALVYGINHYAW